MKRFQTRTSRYISGRAHLGFSSCMFSAVFPVGLYLLSAEVAHADLTVQDMLECEGDKAINAKLCKGKQLDVIGHFSGRSRDNRYDFDVDPACGMQNEDRLTIEMEVGGVLTDNFVEMNEGICAKLTIEVVGTNPFNNEAQVVSIDWIESEEERTKRLADEALEIEKQKEIAAANFGKVALGLECTFVGIGAPSGAKPKYEIFFAESEFAVPKGFTESEWPPLLTYENANSVIFSTKFDVWFSAASEFKDNFILLDLSNTYGVSDVSVDHWSDDPWLDDRMGINRETGMGFKYDNPEYDCRKIEGDLPRRLSMRMDSAEQYVNSLIEEEVKRVEEETKEKPEVEQKF